MNPIITDWLEIPGEATATCRGDWERSAGFESRRKEVVYEHADRLCNPESSTHAKERKNRTANFSLRWVIKRVRGKSSWKKPSLGLAEKQTRLV